MKPPMNRLARVVAVAAVALGAFALSLAPPALVRQALAQDSGGTSAAGMSAGSGAAAPVAAAAPAASAAAAQTTAPSQAVGATATNPVPLATDTPAAAPGDFGYDVFGTATAILDGPVDANYLLSPGDEVVVAIWGELNETMNLVVTPEGFIDLPEGGGRIMTNGVTVGELRPLVLRALSQIRGGYINAQDESKSTAFVDVRLGKIRPVVVYIVGEVNSQGAFPLSAAVANVINLLNNAGGVRRTGSLRDVRIKRTNGTIDSIDLYGFFLRGDIDPKLTRLTQGDYVIVPLKQRSVTITGQVRRPMTFELKDGEGLKELVALAGGFLPDAYLKNVQLVRTEANKGQTYIDLDLTKVLADPKANYPLMDKDQITIGKNVQVRTNSVTVGGEGIKRPGTYEWTPGMKLSDLISKGEGLREYAFLDRADLIRTDDDFTKKLISFPLAGLYAKNPDGTFTLTADEAAAALNFPLREMDEILIQSAWGLAGKDKSVTLSGHVKEPGSTTLAQGMTLYDLLFMRGGFQDPDFTKSTFLELGHLTRKVQGPVGERIIPFHVGKVLANDPSANMPLEDADVIRIYSNDELQQARTVSISGLVNKPGTYPLSEGLTVEDLIVLAGGMSTDEQKVEAVVARPIRDSAAGDQVMVPESIVVPVDTSLSATPSGTRTPLQHYDQVTIRHMYGWDPKKVATVMLEGNVKEPGSVVLTKGMTLYDLLYMHGGFQDPGFVKTAFLEVGHLVRKVPGAVGERLIPFNVGKLLAKDPAANMPLEDADAVRIYSNNELQQARTVTIDGLVNKPGTYPLAEALTVEDLILIAGGMSANAVKAEAVIARPVGDRSSETAGMEPTSIVVPVDTTLAAASATRRTPLRASDKVTIRHKFGWEPLDVASIAGEVKYPGNYPIPRGGARITDLVRLAGALREEAFPQGATLTRRGAGISTASTEFSAGQQITIDLPAALAKPGGPSDLELRDGDKLVIPAGSGLVQVTGAVQRPMAVQHALGSTLSDYINICG